MKTQAFTIFGGLLVIAAFALAISCNSDAHGFVLPQGEDIVGEQVFIEMHCNQCHSVGEIPWGGNKEAGDVHVELGGIVGKVKTYGELVTSVIHPNHKIASGYKEEGVNKFGRSRMKNYNEIMSVQQLIDVVTYLQSEYDVRSPEPRYYPAW